MKVLLNYEFIPEENQVYLLDLEGKELAKVKLLQGTYVNTTAMTPEQEEASNWLAEFLVDQSPVFNSTETHEDSTIDHSVPISDAEIFIQTGFIC